MNALKAEIMTKRKAIEPSTDAPPNKYMRKGDLARLQQEREQREAEEAAAAAAASAIATAKANELQVPTSSMSKAPSPSSSDPRGNGLSGTSSPAPPADTAAFNISPDETVRRFRAKGQPIRLFGESDKDRRLRLRALELIEEKNSERHGGQNDFRRALEEVESRDRERKAQKGEEGDEQGNANANGKGNGNKNSKDETSTNAGTDSEILDLSLLKTDKSKLYPIIYHALKRILKEWEEAMNERPEHIKRSTQGMNAAATQKQSADYMKPLFKNLRSRNMPDDVLGRIAEIVHYTQKREYQRANDAYLRLSIGNAPWPIGVTMVGIHERSAREKISADQVAHVLNDEVSRKYIQSLKRLVTFSQSIHPPYNPSQLMG